MAIVFHVTESGRTAALDAENLGITLKLTHIAVGTSKYNSGFDHLTALKNESARFLLNGGGVEQASKTLRLITTIDAIATDEYFEIGLFTENNTLFAVAAATDDPLIVLHNEISTVFTIGVVLTGLPVENITISLDVNTPIAVQLMNQHLAHSDPHPQYAGKALLAEEIQILNESLREHKEAKDPHSQYATDNNLMEVRTELIELLLLHATANNPHPQYLLASTFGVSLPMTANLLREYTEENRVYGWDGEKGDFEYKPTESWSWGTSGSGVMIFRPWRSYGEFLVHVHLFWMDVVYLTVKSYSKDDVLVEEHILRNGASVGDDALKYVANIQKEGRLEVHWTLKSSYKKKGRMTCNIFVDDRVKIYKPVGYQSIVDSADDFENISEEQKDDYSIYPTAQWFYYSTPSQLYIPLSDQSTLASPVVHIPHYHRYKFATLLNTDLYILIEVGMQSNEDPSDYVKRDISYIQASTDANGDIVVGIPSELRLIEPDAGFKLVYTVLYYQDEVEKDGNSFPDGYLGNEFKIYVDV